MEAVQWLLTNAHSYRTLIIDPITIYWDALQKKWSDIFLKRNKGSKGYRFEFYDLQPRDWMTIKAEFKELIRKLIALDMNVIVTARQKVQYAKDSALKGALAALRDGTGDCDELTSLFVAICRAGGIPARTIRVPGHCYPEFYLLDSKGQGQWFPCEAAGTRSFGEIRVAKPILQKGDNLRVRNAQTRRVESVRFLPETLVVRSFRPGNEPKLKLICQPAEP